ncbi:hypothetical protein BT69DRAFT_1330322 [Atractiella rhizophila]|nr:hypothetical protein BT69DRAFT_1330322 [Atractiella rhizophila]
MRKKGRPTLSQKAKVLKLQAGRQAKRKERRQGRLMEEEESLQCRDEEAGGHSSQSMSLDPPRSPPNPRPVISSSSSLPCPNRPSLSPNLSTIRSASSPTFLTTSPNPSPAAHVPLQPLLSIPELSGLLVTVEEDELMFYAEMMEHRLLEEVEAEEMEGDDDMHKEDGDVAAAENTKSLHSFFRPALQPALFPLPSDSAPPLIATETALNDSNATFDSLPPRLSSPILPPVCPPSPVLPVDLDIYVISDSDGSEAGGGSKKSQVSCVDGMPDNGPPLKKKRLSREESKEGRKTKLARYEESAKMLAMRLKFHQFFSPLQARRTRALESYFYLLQTGRYSRVVASETAAAAHGFGATYGGWSVRTWGNHFMDTAELPASA